MRKTHNQQSAEEEVREGERSASPLPEILERERQAAPSPSGLRLLAEILWHWAGATSFQNLLPHRELEGTVAEHEHTLGLAQADHLV